MKSFPFSFISLDLISYHVHLNPKRDKVRAQARKPPRPAASEVLRHNLLILGGLPSLIENSSITKQYKDDNTEMFILPKYV